MTCKLCGAELPDDTMFCAQCSAKIEKEPDPQVRCGNCGCILQPGMKFCPICGTTAAVPISAAGTDAVPSFHGEPSPSAPKNRKLPLIIGLIAIVAVIAVVIVGLVTDWFGLAAPKPDREEDPEEEQLDFFLDDNFTLEFEMDLDGETLEVSAMVELDWDNDDLTVYANAELDGSDYILAIYEGNLILWDNEYETGYVTAQYADMIELYMKGFQEIIRDKDSVHSFWKNLIQSLVCPFFNISDISLIVAPDDFDDAIWDMIKLVPTEDWLEKNAGYSTSRSGKLTLHTFEPDLYELLKALLAIYEDCIDPDIFNAVSYGLEDNRIDLRNIDVFLEVGMKSGKLTSLECEIGASWNEVELFLEVTKSGKTKIDTAEIEDLINRIQGKTSSEVPAAS